LATPLLVTGLRRVRITAIAMDSRGFGAYPTRTNILNLSRNTLSIVYMILHILVFIILFIWQIILGHGETLIAPIVK
jgi:energy-coupling factor transporter transmembrane protein EcfT